MEIEEYVTFFHEALKNADDAGIEIVRGLQISELAVHIAEYTALILAYGKKVCAGNDDKAALLQTHVGIQVRREISAGFVTLYPPHDHHRGTGFLAVNKIDGDLVVGVFKVGNRPGISGGEKRGGCHH
jgi:hypothetical protein